jgi:hypothetical protein
VALSPFCDIKTTGNKNARRCYYVGGATVASGQLNIFQYSVRNLKNCPFRKSILSKSSFVVTNG